MKQGVVPGFTKQHDLKILVYFEVHENAQAAIWREKSIKRWHRAWKLALIEKNNLSWRDLYPEIAAG